MLLPGSISMGTVVMQIYLIKASNSGQINTRILPPQTKGTTFLALLIIHLTFMVWSLPLVFSHIPHIITSYLSLIAKAWILMEICSFWKEPALQSYQAHHSKNDLTPGAELVLLYTAQLIKQN